MQSKYGHRLNKPKINQPTNPHIHTIASHYCLSHFTKIQYLKQIPILNPKYFTYSTNLFHTLINFLILIYTFPELYKHFPYATHLKLYQVL